MSIDLADNAAQARYEIRVDGRVAGFAQYQAQERAVKFVHTEIDPAYEGQGLGSKLARFALDDVRGRALQVLPACEFIAGWLRKHPEYLDLVPPDSRQAYGL